MISKIFGWIMLIVNIAMVFYVLTTPQDMFAWMIFVFGSELFINIKYLESLK